jgi:hypothetical protein
MIFAGAIQMAFGATSGARYEFQRERSAGPGVWPLARNEHRVLIQAARDPRA